MAVVAGVEFLLLVAVEFCWVLAFVTGNLCAECRFAN